MSRSHSVSGIILSFLISFLSIAILTDRHINPYDEGIILTGAMRVAGGSVPHRDFYANYGPGQFYVLAGLFGAFGQSVLVERIYDAIVKAGIVCLVYCTSCRLVATPLAAVTAGLCILWFGEWGYVSAAYPIWPALFFILLAVFLLFTIFEDHYSTLKLLSCGLCAGAVVVFRYDMGVLSVLILTFVLALYGFISGAGRRRLDVGIMALLLPFLCGAGLIILPLVTAYVLNGVMNDFVFQIIQFPAAHYVQTRSLPFPPIWRTGSSIVYLPPLAILAYIAVEITHHTGYKSKITNPTQWTALLIGTFAGGLYFKGIVRISSLHLAPSIILSLILLALAAKRIWIRRKLPIRPALVVLVSAPLACAAVSSIFAVRTSQGVALENLSEAWRLGRRNGQRAERSGSTDPCDLSADLDRFRCFIVSDAERQAIQFVSANSTRNQPIFVADGENDKTFANNIAFYFLTGRQPATKWYHFDPGLQSSEATQTQIVRDLEEGQPPLIVIDTEFDKIEEPNTGTKHSGVKMVDNYIDLHYLDVMKKSPFKILRRLP
jgi:hypothetical protein